MEASQKEEIPYLESKVQPWSEKFVASEKGSRMEMKKEAAVFKKVALRRL